MHKISFSLIVLLAAVSFVSGCYTKACIRETLKAQQAQSAQNNTNQVVGQPSH